MKRILVLLLTVLLSASAFAQLEVKEGSFKKVDGFVNTNQDLRIDSNKTPFAVIKIKTENINDKQRRELFFAAAMGMYVEKEYKVGEVWVYVTYESPYIKISHKDFGSIDFHFPMDLQPLQGYELVLVNKIEAVKKGMGTLILNTIPENGASIMIDDVVLDEKTPYTTKTLSPGDYGITVSKEGFKTTTKRVKIMAGKVTNLEIDMQYSFGTVAVTSVPKGAEVYIDSQYFGTTPLTLTGKVKTGEHEVKISHKDALATIKKIYVDETKTTVVNETLQTDKEVTITAGNNGNIIYVDDIYAGKSPVTTKLTFGSHSVKAIQNGVKITKQINVETTASAQRFVMEFTNTITVKSDRNDFEVYIDDRYVGKTPYTGTVTCGNHEIKVVGLLGSKKKTVNVNVDGHPEFMIDLKTSETISRRNRYRFYGNMLFRGWSIGPFVGFNNIVYLGDYIENIKSGRQVYKGTPVGFFDIPWNNGQNAGYLLNFIYPIDFHLRENIPTWFKNMRNYNMSIRFTAGMSVEKMLLPWVTVQSDILVYQKRFKLSNFYLNDVHFDYYSEDYSFVSVPLIAKLDIGEYNSDYDEGPGWGGGIGVGYQWDFCNKAKSRYRIAGETEQNAELVEDVDYKRNTNSVIFMIHAGYQHPYAPVRFYGELRYSMPLERFTPEKNFDFYTVMLTIGCRFNVIGWNYQLWKI